MAHFRRRRINRGDFWLREGEVCRHIAFLESGILRHTRSTPEGTKTRWATLPGQYVVNMPSFTQQRPADDSIEASETCVVYEISREMWLKLREQEPQLQDFWIATLEYLVGCFEDRVWSLIAGDAEHRYRYMMERYPDFLLAVPQHFVADMLGIAPRHLSRIRAGLVLKP